MNGIELIQHERAKQVAKGYNCEYDMRHADGVLSRFAGYYALPKTWRSDAMLPDPTWLRVKTRLQELATAGALIAAEIDRVQATYGPAAAPDAAAASLAVVTAEPTAPAPMAPAVNEVPALVATSSCEHLFTRIVNHGPVRIDQCSRCGLEQLV